MERQKMKMKPSTGEEYSSGVLLVGVRNGSVDRRRRISSACGGAVRALPSKGSWIAKAVVLMLVTEAFLMTFVASADVSSAPYSLQNIDHVSEPHHHRNKSHRQFPERHRHRHRDSVCTKCRPGWGVVSKCERSWTDVAPNRQPAANTVCEPCSKGTYSPHHSSVARCWLCSRCGQALFESHPCTPKSDTKCDSCLTARPGPLGPDFDRKCLFGGRPLIVFAPPWEGASEWNDGKKDDEKRFKYRLLGKGGKLTRVQRKTSAFELSGQKLPGDGTVPHSGLEDRRDIGNGKDSNESRKADESESGGIGDTEEDEEDDADNGTTLTWGFMSIAAFQLALLASAAAAVFHYVRKMQSCLQQDKDFAMTAQEVNPLMEVTASH